MYNCVSMERRVNVRGIIVDDEGRVFAVKHRDRTDGSESEYWALPGGGLDVGESINDGLTRELVEEIGIAPKIGRLLFMHQFTAHHRDGRKSEKMELFIHVENTSDYIGDIDLTKTSHGYELMRVEFIDPSTNDILPSFLQTLAVKDHIDNNLPVAMFDNLNEQPR
jgi:8-oxo-dGTP diphosphatase